MINDVGDFEFACEYSEMKIFNVIFLTIRIRYFICHS